MTDAIGRLESSTTADIVFMNYRYSGAWSEVNSRIAQRQNALSIYVTLASVVVTVLFASGRKDAAVDPNIFSLLLPVISISFAFLHLKHDRTIALLREFMAQCEGHGLDKHRGVTLLAYNSSDYFMERADRYRKFHDISSALLVAVFNALGAFAAHQAYPGPFNVLQWPIVVYFLMAATACGVIVRSTFKPHRFTRKMRARKTE